MMGAYIKEYPGHLTIEYWMLFIEYFFGIRRLKININIFIIYKATFFPLRQAP